MTEKTNDKIDIEDLCNFTPKQHEASEAVKKYNFVLYGGAMGGGKSYFLRWKLLRMLLAFANRGFRNVTVGLFCEDYPALKDRHLAKAKFEFPAWIGEYNSTDHNFVLRQEYGGGVIAFRNLDDVSKYQSSEFAVIAVDELTKNKEDVFTFLRTRLRWPGMEDPKFIGATNPGEVGHAWVKKRWIDKEHPSEEKEKDQFFYIQARAIDNPHLSSSYYEKNLASLPEKRRKAFLDGNWDIFEGQYFTEWNREKHVVKPFTIPSTWFRFRSIDISGRNGITSCHWYALDYDKNVIVYREHYASGMDADEHADRIRQMSEGEKYRYTVVDNSAFSKEGYGETFEEIYARHGVALDIKSSKNRLTGWDTVHRYMRWTETTPPKLKIFDTNVNMIKTLPALIHSETNPEDVDTRGEDHAADELRYFLQTLREQKTPRPETPAQKRLRWLFGNDSVNIDPEDL